MRGDRVSSEDAHSYVEERLRAYATSAQAGSPEQLLADLRRIHDIGVAPEYIHYYGQDPGPYRCCVCLAPADASFVYEPRVGIKYGVHLCAPHDAHLNLSQDDLHVTKR